MPPPIMIDQFFAVGDEQHPPAEPVVPLTRLLKAVSRISAVQNALAEELSVTQRLIPFIDIPHRTVDILVAIYQVEEFHPERSATLVKRAHRFGGIRQRIHVSILHLQGLKEGLRHELRVGET